MSLTPIPNAIPNHSVNTVEESIVLSLAANSQGTENRLEQLMAVQERQREAISRLMQELQITVASLRSEFGLAQLGNLRNPHREDEERFLNQRIVQITSETISEQANTVSLTTQLNNLQAQSSALRAQEVHWNSPGGEDQRYRMALPRHQAAYAAQQAAQRAAQIALMASNNYQDGSNHEGGRGSNW